MEQSTRILIIAVALFLSVFTIIIPIVIGITNTIHKYIFTDKSISVIGKIYMYYLDLLDHIIDMFVFMGIFIFLVFMFLLILQYT